MKLNLSVFLKTSLLVFISTCIIFPVKAQNVLEFYVDENGQHTQNLEYCPVYDSICLIAPESHKHPQWNTYDMRDSVEIQKFYLPNNFSGSVHYYSMSDENYGYNWSCNIEVTPATVYNSEDTLIVFCDDFPLTLDGSSNFITGGNISYSWEPADNLDNPEIINPVSSFVQDTGLFTVTISNDQCSHIKKTNIIVEQPAVPEICIVGINENNKNVVHFNKSGSAEIDSVYIFRETFVTDDYELISKADFSNDDRFVDQEANPAIQSNKYILRSKDQCGRLSEKSPAHKTMHLAINQGQNNTWNLIWEHYEGFTPSTYNIYRGSSANNMALIGTSPASNNQYSDFEAPAGVVYYQVEIIKAGACSTTGKKSTNAEYVSSRSNVASNSGSIPDGLSSEIINSAIRIYPNPVNDQIRLEIKSSEIASVKLTLMDLTGKMIMEKYVSNGEYTNVSDLDGGLYIIELTLPDGEKEYRKILKK